MNPDDENPMTPAEFGAFLRGYFAAQLKESKLTEIATVVLTFLIALAAFYTAYIFERQLAEMHKATSDAHESFVKDQRPYIWIANPLGPEDHTPLIRNTDPLKKPLNVSQLFAIIRYTNFGKSPAIDVRLSWDIEYGPDAAQKVKNVPFPDSWELLPPGKVDFVKVYTPEDDSDQLFRYNTTDAEVALLLRWQYLDSSGNRYETDLCMIHMENDAWLYCPSHNGTKNCRDAACDQ